MKNQTWLGLDKLVVNNMITDNSYMKEYLSYDIMSYAGVDAPLYAFADMKVNGEAWGFYLAVEDIDSGYFGGFQGGSASEVVNLPIDTPVSGVSLQERPILGKLLEVETYKKKYHQILQDILDGYFKSGKFEEKVRSLHDLIAEYVRQDPSAFNTYEEYEAAVSELIKLGQLRAESIEGQLNGTIPSTTEGQKGAPDTLIDASSVELSKLGANSFGGRGMGGGLRFGEGRAFGQGAPEARGQAGQAGGQVGQTGEQGS